MINDRPIGDVIELAIQEVLQGKDISGYGTPKRIVDLGRAVAHHAVTMLAFELPRPKSRTDFTIRGSESGNPCHRQLMYKWYRPELGHPPYGFTQDKSLPLKFNLGNYIEEMIIFLMEEAGLRVSHRQHEVRWKIVSETKHQWSVVGHMDLILKHADYNYLIDVKSAADVSFKKYVKEGLKDETDAFGYRNQLLSYYVASPVSLDGAGFLFVNKHDGRIRYCEMDVDTTDLLDHEAKLERIALDAERTIYNRELPDRLEPVETVFGEELCVNCKYCPFKFACWKDRLSIYKASTRIVQIVDDRRKSRASSLKEVDTKTIQEYVRDEDGLPLEAKGD